MAFSPDLMWIEMHITLLCARQAGQGKGLQREIAVLLKEGRKHALVFHIVKRAGRVDHRAAGGEHPGGLMPESQAGAGRIRAAHSPSTRFEPRSGGGTCPRRNREHPRGCRSKKASKRGGEKDPAGAQVTTAFRTPIRSMFLERI